MTLDASPRTSRVLAPLVALLTALSAVAAPTFAGAQTAGFRLEVTPQAVTPGGAITLAVHLDNPTLEAIGGGQLALEFDLSLIHI